MYAIRSYYDIWIDDYRNHICLPLKGQLVCFDQSCLHLFHFAFSLEYRLRKRYSASYRQWIRQLGDEHPDTRATQPERNT